MSLIVANKIKGHIYIVSDTKITYYDKETKPIDGVIKSIIINPFLCVSYAGIIDYANKAIKTYKQTHEYWTFKNHKAIIEYFLKFHRDVDYNTEFIISFGKPSVAIYQIKNGQASNVDTSWIGDKEGFELYQEHYITDNKNIGLHNGYFKTRISKQPEGEDANSDVYNRMLQSISQVVENNKIRSIGQFFVPVVYDTNGFHYQTYLESLTHQIPLELMPDIFPLPMGNAETGAYSFSFTEELRKRERAIVIYILQGRIGIIFLSQREGILKPYVFKDVTPESFKKEIHRLYKFKINTFFDSDEISNAPHMAALANFKTGKVTFPEINKRDKEMLD